MTDDQFLEHILTVSRARTLIGVREYDRLRALAGLPIAKSLPSGWQGPLDSTDALATIERARERLAGIQA